MNKKDYGLGSLDIRSLVLKLSIPSIIAMLSNALYNIVDRIFIGHFVNEVAIGGVYVTMPITMVVMSCHMLASIGGSTLMSIALGKKDHKKAEEYLNTAFVMILIFSAIITGVAFIFGDNILRLFGTTPENHEYAASYFKYIIYGFPASMIGFGMNNFIRSAGDAKGAMTTILIGVITNIILDPIFIKTFNMGVAGAALATIISQYISMVWVLKFFLDKKSVVGLEKKSMGLKPAMVFEIVENGMAQFSINMANAVVNSIIVVKMADIGGAIGVTVLSILGSVTSLFFMPMFGINQGLQPIIGYNYGARDYKRLSEAYKTGAIFSSIIAMVVFFVIMVFPHSIGRLFLNSNADPKVFEYLTVALRKSMLASPVLGIAITGTAFFSAVRRPKIAMFTSLLRQLLILVPLMYIMPEIWGIDGFWWAYTISDFLSFLIVLYYLVRVFRDVKRECEYEGELL
ncbi:MAG: MATE family efflux transporter [Ezakiella sp.]|nr:MATE family efflux transporter [Ezakiella sp.]